MAVKVNCVTVLARSTVVYMAQDHSEFKVESRFPAVNSSQDLFEGCLKGFETTHGDGPCGC
jgi:hypothetical protein